MTFKYEQDMTPEERTDYHTRLKVGRQTAAWYAKKGTFKDELLRVLKSPTAPPEHQQLAANTIDWIEARVKFLVSGSSEDFARAWVAELEASFVWQGIAKLADPQGRYFQWKGENPADYPLDGNAIDMLPHPDPNAPADHWRKYLEEEYRLQGLPAHEPLEAA
jgi:hypothetical protein